MSSTMPKPTTSEGPLSPAGSAEEVTADPRLDRRVRRVFSASEKRRILEEAATCTERGSLAGLLRREGLYSSQLQAWRRQAEQHGAEGLEPKKAGRRPSKDAKDRKISELERQNAKLQRELALANGLISLQKKAHELLGAALLTDDRT